MCEWSTKKIGEIADLILSNVDKHIEPSEKQVLLCNYMDVYNNRYIKNGHKFSYGSVKPDEFEKYRLKINDVIITKDSETPDDIAVPAMVFDEFDGLVCGYHLAILRPNVNLVSGSFLMHVLQLNEVSRFFSRAAKGATRYGITKDAIMNIEIFMPDLVTEQERIADILSNVDNTIEKTEDLIEKYQKIKVGMMQDLFTCGIGEDGKIRPPYHEAPELYKETELGMLPNEWGLDKLNSISQVIDSLHETPLYADYGYKMVRANDIKEGPLNTKMTYKVIKEVFEKFTARYTPKKGDILMSRVGSYGVTCYIESEEKICLGQNVVVIIPKIDNMFIYYYLNTNIVKNQIENNIVGSSQKTLSLAYINKLLVPVPHLHEQQRIAKALNQHNIELRKEMNHLGKLKNLKQALMQDFLTGKVRVTA